MKNYYFKLFFIVLFLSDIIKSEKDCSKCVADETNVDGKLKCSGDDCDEDCMWLKIDSNNIKCLSCDGISKGESKYYSKGVNVEGNPYCHKIGISGFVNKKIIFKTNQIVDNCQSFGLYEMGNVCYHSNPDPTNIEESGKILKCKYYNYKKLIEEEENGNKKKIGLKYYECLAEGQICPLELNYFDDETKECFNSCPNGKSLITEVKETADDSSYIFYKCSSQCNSPTDKKLVKKSALGETKTFCLNNCPEEAKYYYDSDNTCVEYCNKNANDYSKSGNICTSGSDACASKFFLINSKSNYYYCQDSENCPDSYPYTYTYNGNTYCLTTCDDTNIQFFGNAKTKTYLYFKNKECKKFEGSLYLDEKGNQLVDDCLVAKSGPFHEGQKCVESCGTDKYIVEDTNECVSTCDTTNGYFIDEETKTCVRECHSYLERGFYNSEKKCVKCGIDGTGKGFHIESNDKRCFSSCSEFGNNYKYNFKSNICFNNECNNNGNKYTAPDKPNICYNSCTDIDNKEYIYEVNLVCYKNRQSISNINNYYFYKGSNEVNKYISKTAIIQTYFNLGLKYIKNSELVENCSQDEFKIYPTSSSLGFCFSSYSQCKEKSYIYYNNDRVCTRECSNGFILKDSNGILVESRENCLDECPNEYPFVKENICFENCPNNYYEIKGNKKICPDNCNFVIGNDNGKKICSELCTKGNDANGIPNFGYFYTKSETFGTQEMTFKYCINSCNIETLSNKYALEATNEPQSCIEKCPNSAPFYYENDKLCLKECKNFYKGNICVDECNSFIYMENNCVDSCPYDAPFYIEGEDGKKCVTSCNENNYIYFDSNKKCIILDDVQDEKMIFNGGVVNSCPGNLSKDTSSKKCIKPSDWNYFEIDRSTNTASCLSECNSENNKYITTSSECVDKCPLGENFIKDGSNLCFTHCVNEENTLYYQKVEEITLDSNGNKYEIYKCLSTEPSCLYIDGQKKCLDNCGNLYKENGVCKPSCGTYFMFTNEDKFVCKNTCSDFSDSYSYFGTDKMCESQCSFLSTKIIDNSNQNCVNKCTETSEYKYLVLEDNKLHCSNTCTGRYLPSEYKCLSQCPFYTYANEEKTQCLNECPESKKIKFENNEYICLNSETCPEGTYNYENSRFCLASCYPGDYVIYDTNTCVKSCPSQGQKYFYEYDSSLTDGQISLTKNTCVSECINTNKPYTRENNHCDISCDSDPSGDYFYDESDKKCKKQCDNNGKTKKNGNLCKSICNDPDDVSNQNKFEDEKDFCVKECSSSVTGYIYNNKNEFECINECQNGKTFIYNNECLDSCVEGNEYSYNNYCIQKCPKDKRYNEGNEKICLKDCSTGNPYYYKIIATETPNLVSYICQDSCDAYVHYSDSSKKNILCLGDSCTGDYNYYIKDVNNKKQCYSECPEEKHFYKEGEVNIECFENCASISQDLVYYNFKNENKCILLSECKFFDYQTQECVYSCSEFNYIYETDSLTYCLNDCSDYKEKNLYLNYENKCVESCKDNYEKKESQKCECENLFIKDESRGIKSCLHKDEITCEKQVDYPYLVEGTKECSNKCEGIISLDGTICYDSNYQCIQNPRF